jgi:hypothetical protein
MRKLKFVWVPALAAVSALVVNQAGAQQPAGRDLTWAFAVGGKEQPPEPDPKEVVKLPGSDKSYTREQIDDLTNTMDWYPNEHVPARSGNRRTGAQSCGVRGVPFDVWRRTSRVG